MLGDATAIRDAGECREGASPAELAICLPNALKSADSSLDEHLAGADPRSPAAKGQQQRWLAQLDHKCSLHASSSLTRAGWLSYVLSDQTRAVCVLGEMRRELIQRRAIR
jgi:uncharacterized protein YecT (DUF1311 family)